MDAHSGLITETCFLQQMRLEMNPPSCTKCGPKRVWGKNCIIPTKVPQQALFLCQLIHFIFSLPKCDCVLPFMSGWQHCSTMCLETETKLATRGTAKHHHYIIVYILAPVFTNYILSWLAMLQGEPQSITTISLYIYWPRYLLTAYYLGRQCSSGTLQQRSDKMSSLELN